ncbi:MAG: outer membrane beta-barrel protein [Spirochaetaceae bacterium]|nr:outer membrane beta-barrel protein [Spirochaetaceae bacterium]
MITNRSLRFAFCALLLLAPLATLSAQEMDDMMGSDEGFYISAAYSAALPGERDVLDTANTVAVGTGIGFLGGQFGVGYAIAGFRPEVSVGYRTASVDSLKLKKLGGSTAEALLKPVNDMLAADGAEISGSISSLDVALSVYYDVDTGSAIAPYLGVGGGMSQVTVNAKQKVATEYDHEDSLWALSFQAAAGIGYEVTEDLTVALGYRLIGTLEGNFSEYDTTKRKTGMTLNHNVELGLRYSF